MWKRVDGAKEAGTEVSASVGDVGVGLGFDVDVDVVVVLVEDVVVVVDVGVSLDVGVGLDFDVDVSGGCGRYPTVRLSDQIWTRIRTS